MLIFLGNMNDTKYSYMLLFNDVGIWRCMLSLHLKNLTSFLSHGKLVLYNIFLMYVVFIYLFVFMTFQLYLVGSIVVTNMDHPFLVPCSAEEQPLHTVALKKRIAHLYAFWTKYPHWFERMHRLRSIRRIAAVSPPVVHSAPITSQHGIHHIPAGGVEEHPVCSETDSLLSASYLELLAVVERPGDGCCEQR